jgi:hypothetical protein
LAIDAEADSFLSVAIAAVAATFALALRQIALRTENRAFHILPSAFRWMGKRTRQNTAVRTIGQLAALEQETGAREYNI